MEEIYESIRLKVFVIIENTTAVIVFFICKYDVVDLVLTIFLNATPVRLKFGFGKTKLFPL